jgi:hypothetical protein
MSALDLKKRIQERQQAPRARPAQAQLDAMQELTGKPIPPAARPLLQGLTIAEDGTLSYGPTKLTRIGLVFPEASPLERSEADALLSMLLTLDGSLAWMLGDMLAYQERHWGITYQAVAEAAGKDITTMYDYKYVAENVSYRYEILSWTHHKAVAQLPPDQQAQWLDRAAQGNDGRPWSVSMLRRAIAGQPLTREPTALIDRTLSFADRAEREAAKLTPDDRARIADELEAAARRIRDLR